MVNNQKREIKLKDIDNYNVRYGTLDKFNPEVIYITAKTKIKPLEKKGSYVKDVARAILWVILNNISGLFNLGLDKSYLNIQIAQMINRSFFNDTDINYIVDVDEGISSSYMDVSLLLREGFKANYDFESAILDIRKDKFC